MTDIVASVTMDASTFSQDRVTENTTIVINNWAHYSSNCFELFSVLFNSIRVDDLS